MKENDLNVSPELQQELAERSAAHMLMTKWVSENASEVASVIGDLVPFLNGECNIDNLHKAMNVVNVAFATIALEVIKANNRDEPLCLPTDATEMQNAIFDLTKFLKNMDAFGSLLQRNEKTPAFKMCLHAYDKKEIYA